MSTPNIDQVKLPETKNAAMPSIDDELAALLNDDAEVEAVATPEAVDDHVAESALESLALKEATEQQYAEQEAGELDTDVKPVEATKAKRKRKAAPKKESTRVNVVGMTTSAAVKAICGDKWEDYMIFDTADPVADKDAMSKLVEKRLAALDTASKKQREKILNIFHWLAHGKKLRQYSSDAIECLLDSGEFTSAAMRDWMMKRRGGSYGKGTLNSVSQQYVHILPMLELGTLKDGVVTVNANSTIALSFKNAA